MKPNKPLASIKVGLMLSASLCFALISCAPEPPAHGTAYLIQIDTNSAAGMENSAELLKYSPKGNKYYQLAIVLDGRLYSAPRIMGPIPGGRGIITGQFDVQEALALANLLENPLEAPHRIIDEKTF